MAGIRDYRQSNPIISATTPEDALNYITEWVSEVRQTLSGFQAHGAKEIRLSIGKNGDRFTAEIAGQIDVSI